MQNKALQQHFFIFFDADRSSAVVGGVLIAARVPADPWSRYYKCLDLHEHLPQIRPFLGRYHKLMNEPAQRRGHAFSHTEAGARAAQRRDPRYGRFQLNERFNSDQVPLHFVNGQLESWAPKGCKRVSIARPFNVLEKRQCTIQPTIGPGGKLMRCAIIFRGTGKRISKVEKKVYDTRVDPFSRKTRGLTARSAWRGLRSASARAG